MDKANFKGKTLLGRRRLKVIFSDQEKLLLLRAYQAHPCDWNDVISTMRDNLDNLPNEKVRNFYKEASIKSLKDRLCGKLSGMLKNSEKESDEVRTEIDAVRQLEVRLVNDSSVESTTSKSVGPAVPVEPAEPVEPDEPNEPFEPFELSDENDDGLAKIIRPGKKRKREEIDRAKPGTSKSENEREALMKKHHKKSKKEKKTR